MSSRSFVPTVVGVILAGDVKIHHRKWLRYSKEHFAIGDLFWNISREEGSKQLVSDPTRGEYLLDIVHFDVGDMRGVSMFLSLADHRVVCMDINIVIARTTNASREVWDIRHADWDGLKSAITSSRWGDF